MAMVDLELELLDIDIDQASERIASLMCAHSDGRVTDETQWADRLRRQVETLADLRVERARLLDDLETNG